MPVKSKPRLATSLCPLCETLCSGHKQCSCHVPLTRYLLYFHYSFQSYFSSSIYFKNHVSFLTYLLVNFQMFKLVLEKAEEPIIKLPTSDGSSKKQESSRKTSISALLAMQKPLTAWIITNCGKFWKRWEYQTTWPTSWEVFMQVRKQQLELDMEHQTGYK